MYIKDKDGVTRFYYISATKMLYLFCRDRQVSLFLRVLCAAIFFGLILFFAIGTRFAQELYLEIAWGIRPAAFILNAMAFLSTYAFVEVIACLVNVIKKPVPFWMIPSNEDLKRE